MSDEQYLIEKGGERKYIPAAELNAHAQDGWRVLGHKAAAGAVIKQRPTGGRTPKPQAPAKPQPAADNKAAADE